MRTLRVEKLKLKYANAPVQPLTQPRWKRIHCRRSSSSSAAIELTPAAAPPFSRRCRSISRAIATSFVIAALRSDGASGGRVVRGGAD